MALVEAPERSRDERKAADAVIAALAARCGNRLVTSQAVREQHGHTTTWPSSEVPWPKPITGTRCAAQSRTMSWTSAVVCGNATASGG